MCEPVEDEELDESESRCSHCEYPVCRTELDDAELCPDCAQEARDEARALDELRADWRASRL